MSGVVPLEEQKRQEKLREEAKALYEPKRGGCYEVWEQRPLQPILLDYAASDVKFMLEMKRRWAAAEIDDVVQSITQDRIAHAVRRWEPPQGPSMAKRDFPLCEGFAQVSLVLCALHPMRFMPCAVSAMATVGAPMSRSFCWCLERSAVGWGWGRSWGRRKEGRGQCWCVCGGHRRRLRGGPQARLAIHSLAPLHACLAVWGSRLCLTLCAMYPVRSVLRFGARANPNAWSPVSSAL